MHINLLRLFKMSTFRLSMHACFSSALPLALTMH